MQNGHSELEAVRDHFWHHGYAASSITELVKASGTNRAALYGQYGGKDGLFAACLHDYARHIVAPALAEMRSRPGLEGIERYFKFQIALADEGGLPGPGCLMANTMAERSAHDARVRQIVWNHMSALRKGFTRNLNQVVPLNASPDRVGRMADLCVVTAQGLWTVSRTVETPGPLYDVVSTFLQALKGDQP